MSYKIDHYRVGYEKGQAKIAAEIGSDWQYLGRPSAEYLKDVYSREGFDPETRLYAFKDDEMVGFLAARILPDQEEEGVVNADLSFPVCKKGHEDMAEILLKKGLKVLSKKGVTLVRSRVGKTWSGAKDLLKAHGYEVQGPSLFVSEGKPEDLPVVSVTDAVSLYDPENDEKNVAELFADVLGWTEEQFKTNMNNIAGIGDNLVGSFVYREGGRIVARQIGYLNENDTGIMSIGQSIVKAGASEGIRAQLISAVMAAAKKRGVKAYRVFAGGPNAEDQKKAMGELGFEFNVAMKVLSKTL